MTPSDKTVTVRVVLSVDVDPEAWEQVYGDPPDELRNEVRSYFAHLAHDCAAAEDGAIVGARVLR